MQTVGLITEYNPFHNGHLHHLRESLKAANADVSVAVMSGHFLQRGEPALVDKWVRTEMALAAGVDVVVELPLPWACSSAPNFARGGVQAFNALGGIDALCFGSEAGELPPLQQAAGLLLQNEKELEQQTADLLREGLNYPQARAKVLEKLLPHGAISDVVSAPNNILGIEYLKALRQTASSIQPLTIQRIGAGYHDTEIGEQNIASATGIRQKLSLGDQVDELLPVAALKPFRQALAGGSCFSSERYSLMLLGQILRDPQNLPNYWLVENGIENRLLSVAEKAANSEELIAGVKSRQLTRTRIQRLLVAVLLGITKDEVLELLGAGPTYLHLLGVSKKGEKYLATTRKQRALPLVQNFSRVHNQLKRYYLEGSESLITAQLQFDLELRATRIYTLLMKNWSGGKRNRDYFEDLRKG